MYIDEEISIIRHEWILSATIIVFVFRIVFFARGKSAVGVVKRC